MNKKKEQVKEDSNVIMNLSLCLNSLKLYTAYLNTQLRYWWSKQREKDEQ